MVQAITLPGDYHFIFIDSNRGNPRVILNNNDIKAVELSHVGDAMSIKIVMFDKTYEFSGQDALDIEEFFLTRMTLGTIGG